MSNIRSHNNAKQRIQNLFFYVFIEPGHGYKPGQLTNQVKIDLYQKKIARIFQNPVKFCDFE